MTPTLHGRVESTSPDPDRRQKRTYISEEMFGREGHLLIRSVYDLRLTHPVLLDRPFGGKTDSAGPRPALISVDLLLASWYDHLIANFWTADSVKRS